MALDSAYEVEAADVPATQGVTLDMEEGPAAVADDALRERLRETISNTKLSERFLALARDLDVMEPRAPDDVRDSNPNPNPSASTLTP